MAVFRSDQSQLTYAMESAPGGDVELNNGTRTGSGYAARINGAVALGSSQIVVDTKTGADLVIGDFIRISDSLDASSDAAASTAAPYEIRRVLHATALDGSGTLFLDRPVGFAHIDNGYVHEVTAVESTTGQQKIITEVPGVYESVNVPDMVPSYEPRYFLGVGQKRDWTKMYVGAQSFSGSLPGFIPLNGKPFRWSIGTVSDIPSAVESASTDIDGAVSKGDIYVTLDGSHGYSAGD